MASIVQILVLVDAVTKVNFKQVGLKMPILLPFVVFEKFCPRSLTQYPTNSLKGTSMGHNSSSGVSAGYDRICSAGCQVVPGKMRGKMV